MVSRHRVALGWPLRLSAAAAVGVTLLTALLWVWSMRRVDEMRGWVERSYQARTRLNQTLALVSDAETGQRGYLLTNDRRYLEPFAEARKLIPQRLASLRRLAASDPVMAAMLTSLEERVAAKLAELRGTLRVFRRSGLVAAIPVIRSDRGKEQMDAVREVIGRMLEREDALLQQRSTVLRRVVASAHAAMSGALLLAFLVTLLLIVVVRRSVRERVLVMEEREALLADTEQARAEAEAASRTKDAFLATLSHELRTPLTPILTWARLLRLAPLDAGQRTKALDSIERCARTQAQLVGDLLDVSRIVSGKIRLEVRPVTLPPIIQAAIEVVRPGAEAKGITIRAVLDPDAGPVSGDPQRLQQVVWNLLSNAVKFTPKGGTVEVVLERVGSHVEIAVKDTGQGIRAEFLPHVFERFQQQDRSAARMQGGLGLGLAIVRHLVELHGGGVEAQSQGEGAGSVFTVRLPVMAMIRTAGELYSRRPPSPLAADGPLPRLDGLRIALVDDDVESNEVVRTMLLSCGAEVETASSAVQGSDLLTRWEPDVLISDIAMPGEDGLVFIGKVRAREGSGRHVPAVALTAFAGIDDRARSLAAGFDLHVAKPVDPLELASIVGSLARASGRSAGGRTTALT